MLYCMTFKGARMVLELGAEKKLEKIGRAEE